MDFTKEELDDEEWRPIPGFEGYEASNLGNIRSYWSHGVGTNLISNFKTLKGYYDRDGYRRVKLKTSTPKDKWIKKIFGVHALVALAFIGPRPEGLLVCHKDGNPSNNRANNLSYKTPKENMHDKFRHNTMPHGENHYSCKVTNDAIVEIYTSNLTSRELANKFNIDINAVNDFRSGKRRGVLITKNLKKGNYEKFASKTGQKGIWKNKDGRYRAVYTYYLNEKKHGYTIGLFSSREKAKKAYDNFVAVISENGIENFLNNKNDK